MTNETPRKVGRPKGSTKYPLGQLGVGESFVHTAGKGQGIRMASILRGCARNNGGDFKISQKKDTVTVTRLS